MKQVFLYITLFIQTLLFSQVEFTAKTSRNSLGVNEKVQVTFSINADGDDFRQPEFSQFKIIGGPFQSTNFSWINGKKSFHRSYSFILQPKKQGTLTIGKATITYNNEEYQTKPIKIKVTAPITIPKNPNSPEYKAGKGVHLVAEISKKETYINQPLTVVYKLYFNPRFNITNIQENENPKYNGFWSQHIDIKKLKAVPATYNGQDYAMVTWRKVLLYPQEIGKKQLEPLVINLDVEVPVRRRMGGFFETIDYETTSKIVTAGTTTINVKALPEADKPTTFTGAVGDFTFEVIPSKTVIKNNESLDVQVKVSGKGNLQLFNLPKLEFPTAFEVFDPQYKEELKTPLSGINGTVSETYTIVPQYKGKYTIHGISFSYFDTKSKNYKTITSKPIEINVLQGKTIPLTTTSSNQGKTVEKQEINTKKAFQFISLATTFQPTETTHFFKSNLFYLLTLLPFLILPLLVLAKKKNDAINADVFGNKIKQNSRLAKKYLSNAKKQIGNKVPFYIAMEKALHNFLKAKLHIETIEMSKENIEQLLIEKGAKQATILSFIEIINNCEFARYTPSSDVTMQNDYDKAVDLIAHLQRQLKQ